MSIYNTLNNLPTPSTINYAWNFGSLLGLRLIIQILTGFFLSLHYSPDVVNAFDKVLKFRQEVNLGWLIRYIHSSGASIFFIFCYFHIGKALVYESFYFIKVWISGCLILLTLMGSAFLGYVLPWGQISFWGATVITNLISVIPYIGKEIVEWLWGGFNVGEATLNRFFSFHFILPFVVIIIVIIHIIFLHSTGSSNPLGIPLNIDKLVFFNYYVIKDAITIVIALLVLFFVSLQYPYTLIDHENFILANPMVTPPHIQPEWYFLFAYAILRSIPNKVGGVIFLLLSILIILTLPFLTVKNFKGRRFNTKRLTIFWFHVGTFIILTWLGRMPVEDPYVGIRKIYTLMYFVFYFLYPLV